MGFALPQSEADLPHDYFQPLFERMFRAGWLKSAAESSQGIMTEYTERGRERMVKLARIAGPFVDRCAIAQRVTLAGRLAHDFRLMILEFRCAVIAYDLKLSLTSGDVTKLVVLAAFFRGKAGAKVTGSGLESRRRF